MIPHIMSASLAAVIGLAPSSSQAQSAGKTPDRPILLAQSGPPPLPAPAPPPLPQPPAAQFYYSENGKPVGPVPLSEIQAKIAAGVITPDTLVWKSGTPNWVAAKELSEVAT